MSQQPRDLTQVTQLTPEEILARVERARKTDVSDALDLMTRRYRTLAAEGDPRQATGAEYLGERCAAMAGSFRDHQDPTRCALAGKANGVDLLRGFRSLAAGHPNPEAQNIYSAMGNCLAGVLTDRADLLMDVSPEVVDAASIRGTLTIWHELVVRASQIARRPHGSTGAIHVVGRSADVRGRILAELVGQSMAELGVLIRGVGLVR